MVHRLLAMLLVILAGRYSTPNRGLCKNSLQLAANVTIGPCMGICSATVGPKVGPQGCYHKVGPERCSWQEMEH